MSYMNVGINLRGNKADNVIYNYTKFDFVNAKRLWNNSPFF